MPGFGLIIRGLCVLGIGAELKFGAPVLLIPWGSLIFARPPAIAPLGPVDVLFCDNTPPGNGPLRPELASFFAKLGRLGGAPCLDREKAFILACISDVKPLALEGSGPGRRAALSGPRGAEEAVMVFGELSKEVRSDGGLGDVVAGGAAVSKVGELGESTDALSVSICSCAGGSAGLSCRGSSIIADSVICSSLSCLKPGLGWPLGKPLSPSQRSEGHRCANTVEAVGLPRFVGRTGDRVVRGQPR